MDANRHDLYMPPLLRAVFVSRPNRFIVMAELEGTLVRCHMPNPGRMWELLFPGVVLYVRPAAQEHRKTAYDVAGLEREGIPVLLDTQYTNDVAAYLVAGHHIPGWEDWELLRREYTVGESRFDLLLGRGEERFLLEVKSCTLFGRTGAMFPDAVTERGRKHVLHLARLAREGWHTGILFLVQWERACWFLPDYHTDPAFAEAFYEAAPVLDWKALALRWTSDFKKPEVIRTLAYPEKLLERENHDSGDYLFVLHVTVPADILVGALGVCHFAAGYYVYVGSARRNLAARLARHRRKRKQLHWHIDYLRRYGEVIADIPIRTADDLEHELAAAVSALADWPVGRFGCTDCTCPSHLFGFFHNPVHNQAFMRVVESFRINRLEKIRDSSDGELLLK